MTPQVNWYNQANNLFKTSALEGRSDLSYHTFTTDHPFLAQLGLSVFTTGELSDFFNKKDAAGEYVNVKLIAGAEDPKDAIKKLLGFDIVNFDLETPHPPCFFTAFRKDALTGSYELYEFPFVSPDKEGTAWRYPAPDLTYGSDSLEFSSINLDGYTNKFLKLNDNNYPELAENDPDGNIDTFFSNIITLNDAIRYDRMVFGSGYKWYLGSEDSSSWRVPALKAGYEFILDVKTSKEKCITWSGVVNFDLNPFLTSVDQQVLKSEWVTYKLFLFDEYSPRDTTRSLTVNNLTLVAPKTDIFGNIGNTVDGEKTGETTPTAGTINLQWNEIEKKFESGTPQSLAVLSTNIPPASRPDFGNVIANTVLNLLNLPDRFFFPSGLAIPIRNQNGNALQWSPNYALPASCRGDNKDKEGVVVYNPLNRPWSSGEYVIINKIDGVWLLQQIEPPKESGISTSFDGAWSFMYLMTNSDYFFRGYNYGNSSNPDKGRYVTYQEYEQEYANLYYRQGEQYRTPLICNQYFQTTSWDFMGPKFGGTRVDKNILDSTIFFIDSNNSEYIDRGKFNDSIIAPFFGCVFPEGYVLGEKYNNYKNGSYSFVVKNPSDGIFFNIPNGANLFENDSKLIGQSGIFFRQDDVLVRHLPADIALNASPRGVNGRPLEYVGNFNIGSCPRELNEDNISNNLLQNQLKEYFKDHSKRYYWVANSGNDYSSAFDFAPINPARIMFRPLAAELYDSFQNSLGPSSIAPRENERAGEFSQRLKLNMFNGGIAEEYIAKAAWDRNKTGSLKYEGPSDNVRTLRYNIWNAIPGETPFGKHPYKFWDQGWMIGNGNFADRKSAGAVGIIGACCTVTAASVIGFQTENYIGIGSNFIGTITNPFLPPRVIWEPAWGSEDNYNSFNTTALYVRAFHAWPRDLTIYDPRYFAVHHFNFGAAAIDDPPQKKYFQGKNFLGNTEPEDFPGDGQEDYPNGFYSTDVLGTPVDFYVPTLKNGKRHPTDQFNTPVSASSNVRLRKNEWRVDTSRRGKLLPYPYEKITIGVGTSYIQIIDRGQGYGPQDTFRVTGGAGTGVSLKPIVGVGSFPLTPSGQILGFEILSSGDGYIPLDFPGSGTNFTVRIVEDVIKTAGKGFRGGFVSGIIYKYQTEDPKPKEITQSALRLTPRAKVGPVEAIAGAAGISDTIEINQIILSDKSKDNKYDLFFHFHNDISHTFLFRDWGADPIPVPQHVTLDIRL